MSLDPTSIQTRRHYGLRYVILVILVLALMAVWVGLWKYAAGQVAVALDGWSAREAKAGRVYACGTQSIGGFPFRFELDCAQASAELRGSAVPLKIAAHRVMLVAQVYEPMLLIGEYDGPLTISEPGQTDRIVATWRLAQSSLRGTPAAPERAAFVVDDPQVERVTGNGHQSLMRAHHVELHGRIVEGSVDANPVVELALELDHAALPVVHSAAIPPFDANIVISLRGLKDFSPKPWPARFREIQAAGGRIEINRMRLQQGDTVAVGDGALSLNAEGRLQGALRLTVAGIEPFLKAIGAREMVQNSSQMDKVAGFLDRLSPGLGAAARQQAGANISLGLNLIGQPTTLDGKPALALPLRFEDGAMLLGPIPIGVTPALF